MALAPTSPPIPTSSSLVDATTLMLRALNNKMDDLTVRTRGPISPEGMRQMRDLFEEQRNLLQSAINRADPQTLEIIADMFVEQEIKWKDQNVEMMKRMSDLAAEITKTVRGANVSPENINPQRRFVKEGVIETITQNVHLFFPYTKNVEQPPNTCVLRNIKTMEVMMVNPLFYSLVNLPKRNPTRMLISHGLIPVGIIPAIAQDLTEERLLILTSVMKQQDPNFNIVLGNAFNNDSTPVRVKNASLPGTPPIPLADTLHPIPTSKGYAGNYFNATILLAFASGYWAFDTPMDPAFQYYQTFFNQELGQQKFIVLPKIPEISLLNLLPKIDGISPFMLFLWNAVRAWNLL